MEKATIDNINYYKPKLFKIINEFKCNKYKPWFFKTNGSIQKFCLQRKIIIIH